MRGKSVTTEQRNTVRQKQQLYKSFKDHGYSNCTYGTKASICNWAGRYGMSAGHSRVLSTAAHSDSGDQVKELKSRVKSRSFITYHVYEREQ